MLKRRIIVFVTVVILALAGLGLTGCRQDDSEVTPTPAVLATPQRQLVPMLGGGESSPTSPLPTPGTGSSPITP